MRPVNLIPPEDRRGEHAPLRAGFASYAIVGVLVVALIGVVLVILTGNQITDSKAELACLAGAPGPGRPGRVQARALRRLRDPVGRAQRDRHRASRRAASTGSAS